MNLVDAVEKQYLKKNPPEFRVGDTVKVHMRIVEGEKERIQVIEGVVIRKRGGGTRETFTVRKVSYNIGVERIFPLHSPRVEKVEIVRRNKIRRAKLYYLRDLRGKAARLTEKFQGVKKVKGAKAKAKEVAKDSAEPAKETDAS